MPDSQDRFPSNEGIPSPSDPVNREFYQTHPISTPYHVGNGLHPGGETVRRDQAPPASVHNGISRSLADDPCHERASAPITKAPNTTQPVPRHETSNSRARLQRAAAEAGERKRAVQIEALCSLSDVNETPSQSQSDVVSELIAEDTSSESLIRHHLADETATATNQVAAKKEKVLVLTDDLKKKAGFTSCQTSVWMRKKETLTCILMTDGLPHAMPGKRWILPLSAEKKAWMTMTEMTNDLRLQVGDTITFRPAEDVDGTPVAHVYIKKKQSNLVTPMAQGTVTVPVGDTTLNGAKSLKPAGAAAIADGASPSGTGKERLPRTFHGKKQSERRESENPQLNQKRHQVEEPAPVAAAPPPPKRHQVEDPAPAVAVNASPVNAPPPPPRPPVVPTPTPAPAPTAAATGTGFLNPRVNHGVIRRKLMLDLLERHNVSRPTTKALGKIFFEISEEDWECVYAELVAVDDSADSDVQELADEWVCHLAHLQNMQNQ